MKIKDVNFKILFLLSFITINTSYLFAEVDSTQVYNAAKLVGTIATSVLPVVGTVPTSTVVAGVMVVLGWVLHFFHVKKIKKAK